MIDVTVKVPGDRVPEFYSMYGAWLNGQAQGAVQSNATGESAPDRKDWSLESDAALAAEVWERFSEPAKRLFSTLIDNPGTHYSGDALANILGLSKGRHAIAGLLGWPGRHCYAANREWMWSWSYPDGELAEYWCEPDVAALFREARDGCN